MERFRKCCRHIVSIYDRILGRKPFSLFVRMAFGKDGGYET